MENNNSKPNGVNKYKLFSQIVKEFYNEELEKIDSNIDSKINNKGTIKLVPKLTYDKYSREMKIEFKIGNKKLYKIRTLSEFYKNMLNHNVATYGNKLTFIHSREMFEDSSKELLDFVMKYAEAIWFANSAINSNYRYYGKALNDSYIIISNSALDELFDILKGQKIEFQRDLTKGELELIDGNPEMEFDLNETENQDEYKIIPKFNVFVPMVLRGRNYKYVLIENKLYRCTTQFEESNLKLFGVFRDNYLDNILLSKNELKDFYSIFLPEVHNAITIDKNIEEKIKEYKPENLEVRVFLDIDSNGYIVADVRLRYGENEFNPLDTNEEKEFKSVRNVIEETKALNAFRKTGFMFDTKNLRFILPDEEKIYEFLTNDIEYYMKKFEVMATDEFRKREIIKPKIGTLGVRTENNLLMVDLGNLNIDLNELEGIMDRYRLKKKYYRLKNGDFLDLTDNKELDFLDKLISGTDVSYNELKTGSIRVPINRSLYLNQLLKALSQTEISRNNEFKQIVNSIDNDFLDGDEKVPTEVKRILRPYQRIGFEWLKTLDDFKLGGILADDMGLGKTLQMITVFLDYKNNNKNHKASIVISPSSLVLNWKSEIEKFAPDLKILVISGTSSQRNQLIDKIENYDVAITSYDLLKRDMEKYEEKNYNFKYIVADEAQYLKNNNTQNAKTIKKLKSETKFALTGTPIENSLAELWSIFDFVMPGYLFSYKKFKTNYEMPIVRDNDKREMEKLKLLIEPFVLRRTKKQVLTELPEKTVTILNNEMNEEQKNIYLSYLMRARNEIQKDIDINGISKNHIQILAALTRLRQICCHPGLFIENYNGTSSKLEQCMEIIEEGINAGHKILLFSTYTSIFPFIEEKLNEKNIKYFKLTGATKVDERLKLVDEFNENSDVKVFLISLKAGGTGLNLIGADMVIHYDPWWNLSAENQATDRAYRIGQKNNVQVYKLITKDSIEEKIYDLQNKKGKLTENMLDTKTTFISKLSKEEIMNLFN